MEWIQDNEPAGLHVSEAGTLGFFFRHRDQQSKEAPNVPE
jgi:hypothetical protein